MKKVYIGIDISKNTFDIAFKSQNKMNIRVFDNSIKGFRQFLKIIPPEGHCVMEATGPYYLKLAAFLFKHKLSVSVRNPLIIKRFMQMVLQRTKTDKMDAKTISEYGEKMDPPLWTPPEEWILSLQQKQTAVEMLDKQIQMLKNQIEAFSCSIVKDKSTIKSLETAVRNLKKVKGKIETEAECILKENNNEMYQNLLSISSLGPKAVSHLITITHGFKKFETCKQLQAYVGFCPRIFRSGTSVRGRGAICKMGMSRLRKILYMCSLTAVKYNPQCKELYDRLVNAGKAKKLALVAVANKLLRQAFKIAKSGTKYDKNYSFALAK